MTKMPSRREVCLLIGKDGSILWCDASTTPFALPDRRERWEAIWSRRDAIPIFGW